MDHGGGGYRGRGGGRGGGGHHGGGGYNKRPREDLMERSPLLRVREFVMRNVGTEDHLKQCTALLVSEIDAGRAGLVTDVVLECVCELPVKTSVYATLVALLNCERRDAVAALLAHTQLVLRRALSLGPREAQRARVLVRFLATCGSCRAVDPAAALAMLRALAAAALAASQDAARTEGWQARADALVYYALSALAFAGSELPEGDAEGLASFTALVEAYMAARETRGVAPEARPLAGTGPDGEDDGAAALEDYLDDLWGRVCVSAQAGSWEAATLRRARVHAPFRAHLLARSTPHDATLLQDVPPLAAGLAPRSAAAAAAAFPPRPRMRLLPREATEGADPGRMPIERFLAEELIADTLWAWEEGARTAGAKHMAAEQLAVGLPLDLPHSALLAETLFAHACAQPAPRFRLVYYEVVLTDLCTMPAEVSNLGFCVTLTNAVGAAVRRMHAPGAVHPVTAEAIAQLLSSHLASTELQWPWEKWAAVAKQRRCAPQRRFVEDVLRRLLRLSYHARVANSLPPALLPLLGPAPAPEAGWPYGGEGGAPLVAGAEADAARSLLALARAKAAAADMSAAADAVAQQLGGATQALAVLGTVLFFHGRKTITHLTTMLTRYEATLARLTAAAGDEAAAGAALLRAAAAFWAVRAGSEQGLFIAADRLLGLRIIPAAAVVAWLFDDATRPLWPSAGPWAVLECAMERELAACEVHTNYAEDAAAAAADAAMAAEAAMAAAEAAGEAVAAAPSAAADAVLTAAAAAEADAVRHSESMAEAAQHAQPAADDAVAALRALVLGVAERFSAAATAAAEAAEAATAEAEAAGAPPRAVDAAEEAMAQAVAVHDAFRSFAARHAPQACTDAPRVAALLDAAPPPNLPVDTHALLPAPPPAPAPPVEAPAPQEPAATM